MVSLQTSVASGEQQQQKQHQIVIVVSCDYHLLLLLLCQSLSLMSCDEHHECASVCECVCSSVRLWEIRHSGSGFKHNLKDSNGNHILLKETLFWSQWDLCCPRE